MGKATENWQLGNANRLGERAPKFLTVRDLRSTWTGGGYGNAKVKIRVLGTGDWKVPLTRRQECLHYTKDAVFKFLTVRNLISNCTGGGCGNVAVRIRVLWGSQFNREAVFRLRIADWRSNPSGGPTWKKARSAHEVGRRFVEGRGCVVRVTPFPSYGDCGRGPGPPLAMLAPAPAVTSGAFSPAD